MVGLAVARRREIGVRLSLGAPRRRLIRQLLTETVMLSLIAAAIGLVLTAAGTTVADARFPDVQLAIDWRVILATCAVAIATGVLFGLSPALHATRISVGESLMSSATAVAATRSRLQRTLVVAQIALTQPLLVGLGVVITTIITDANGRATKTSAAEQIVEVELNTFTGRVTDAERAARIDALVDRMASLPGVVAAVPMQLGTVTAPLAVHDADIVPGRANTHMPTHLTAAPRGYFDLFGIRIVRGRDFDASELLRIPADPGTPLHVSSVIIGGDLARKLWGDRDPIGRRLVMATGGESPAPITVVGVVDERVAGPSEVNGVVRVYVPYSTMNTGVIARTAGPASLVVNAMRRAAMDIAPAMPVVKAQTVAQREAQFRSNVFRTSALVACAGMIALLLSAIGLYAVVALVVGQRTREIGIRTALGAQRGQVVRLFFMKGIGLSIIGLLLGLPLSMLATRYISSSLNWPLSSSPLIGVTIGAVVLCVAAVAAWIPARRASAVDPVAAVRAE
jgi:predicted permease